MEATIANIQEMVTVEDYDVSECFHHSNSMESVKSTFSESYLSKPSLAKRRANQQETEQFYFTVSTGCGHQGFVLILENNWHILCNSPVCLLCVVEAERVSGRQEPYHQAGGQA